MKKLKKLKKLKSLSLVVLIVTACSKPPLWLVSPDVDGAWRSFVWAEDAPFAETALFEGTRPANRYGFIITTTRPGDAGEDEPTDVYQGLYQAGGYGDSIVLAIDPWIVFYEFTGSSLTRARAEKPGEGVLILPGAEEDAVLAWTAQFVQSRPGVFPAFGGQTLIDALIDAIRAGAQFQKGAQTYNWANSWSVFFESKPSWIYAPYSVVRAMPPIKTAGFEACRFPTPADWESYGVQAAVLWATPFFGSAKEQAKLEAARAWLVSADTQRRIADAFNWLPAHPDIPPANALARTIQGLCARAEFVWTAGAFE
ncbi:MAG: hypothetical protein LBK73_02050 [Treponema sp.]|nr:hypothetical protein [Treponema sp.]